eukprot:CAMPEP_0114638428 /NCGR_PEP_ID=MMETSP0191-20121206/614_1 /TAXON_ID=126664 /ORGANISM="Sorites sp." /LENGTH=33 /DNA_ID= /DNA_START= /DNA_END= /DNA_ORIENTATION=
MVKVPPKMAMREVRNSYHRLDFSLTTTLMGEKS